ncbi:MAG TPA: Lrp/AsnC ligand binding domain-containing protein [Solirubrobacteraceae bacterium]
MNESAAGVRIVVLMDVRLRPGTPAKTFEDVIVQMPAVTDGEHLTGHFDYQLRVACKDVAELDGIIHTLKTSAGVIETSSRLALRVVVHRGGP